MMRAESLALDMNIPDAPGAVAHRLQLLLRDGETGLEEFCDANLVRKLVQWLQREGCADDLIAQAAKLMLEQGGQSRETPRDWFAVAVLCAGGDGALLLQLANRLSSDEECIEEANLRKLCLRELYTRGWRLQAGKSELLAIRCPA